MRVVSYDAGMAGALAILQARMSSSRLPGKSLAEVGGEPMLALLVRRLRRAGELERIVVATTTEPDDDAIEEVARARGCEVYRGPKDDVLARFVGAAMGYSGVLARLTADCPLIDSQIVDRVIRAFRSSRDCVYASNIEPRTYPKGLDVEVFSSEVLRRIVVEAHDPYDREHVTTFIRRDPERFQAAAVVHDQDLGDLRWVVDTMEDLEFVREVVSRLGPRRDSAGMNEILEAVRDEPSLASYNGRRG
jgi:spore coat polysaccharide biosynthesis protein SpsF